jgi:hypothetical protein
MNRRDLLRWLGIAPLVASLPVVAIEARRVDRLRVPPNSKLLAFTKEINREFIRENLFAPYASGDLHEVLAKRMKGHG